METGQDPEESLDPEGGTILAAHRTACWEMLVREETQALRTVVHRADRILGTAEVEDSQEEPGEVPEAVEEVESEEVPEDPVLVVLVLVPVQVATCSVSLAVSKTF